MYSCERLYLHSRTRTVVFSLLLLAATFALYYQIHTHPWFDLDDSTYIVENVHLHTLNWTTVWWSIRTLNYANWIPLSWLSHAIDYQLFGGNPAGHHLENVFWHALNAILVFWVLKRATGYTMRSFMVAALFVVEPLNVEPVVWVAERKTLLSMFFFLLTFAAYQWYARQPSTRRFDLVFILFGLALAAKSQVITLPCALLLWDYWPLQRMNVPWREPATEPPIIAFPRKDLWWLVKEKLPLLFLCGVDALLTIYTQKSVRIGLMPPISIRLKNAIYAYWLYLKDAFWPSRLAPESPQMGRFVSNWQVIGIVLLLIAISGAVVAARRHRYLPVGWFWFLGTLLPMIGLLQPSQQGSADRFVYQAYLGLFIIVCWGGADWATRWRIPRAWVAGAAALVLTALAIISNRQIRTWSDNIKVWEHAVAVNQYHWVARDDLGWHLMNQRKSAEALEYFRQANTLNPDDGFSNLELGFHEQALGDTQGAIAFYQRGLRDVTLDDKFQATAWRDMGVGYRDLGDKKKALECFRRSASYADK